MAALHVALVAPPWFPVPPHGYGGIESVCASLADGLVAAGHEVTLVCAGPSDTAAQHVVTTRPRAPSEQVGQALPELVHALRAAPALDAPGIDVVHHHGLAGPLLEQPAGVPVVVTAHGSVTGEFGDYYAALPRGTALVAISAAQVRAAPHLPWAGVVHNAVPLAELPFHDGPRDKHVLFLGRFHPEKAPHLAIHAARAAGREIVLSGKCSEPVEQAYFDAEVTPLLGEDTTVLGPVRGEAKLELLSQAAAVLFPMAWEEPFGLVLVEAMAVGTPIVAFARGAAPEIVPEGVGGWLVGDVPSMAAALDRLDLLDMARARRLVESRFCPQRMVADYVRVYERLRTVRRRRRHP